MAKWGVWCKPKRGRRPGRPGWFRYGYGTLLTFKSHAEATKYVTMVAPRGFTLSVTNVLLPRALGKRLGIT